jgi:hypothetical protein
MNIAVDNVRASSSAITLVALPKAHCEWYCVASQSKTAKRASTGKGCRTAAKIGQRANKLESLAKCGMRKCQICPGRVCELLVGRLITLSYNCVVRHTTMSLGVLAWFDGASNCH